MLRGDQKNLKAESGAVLIIVAVCLIMIFGFAALVIDGSYIYTTQNQLHVAADGAALAGATQIFNSTDCGSTGGVNYPARTQAQTFAAFNKAGYGRGTGTKTGQQPVTLDLNTGNDPNGDIILGNFNTTSSTFTPCPVGTPVNAVRVRSRRNSETGAGIDPSNAPVFTFFAPVLNSVFNTRDVKTKATAMTGVRANVPMCVPSCIANNPACFGSSSSLITLHTEPETQESIAWTSFTDSPTNPTTINPYINGTKPIACVGLQTTINLINGNAGIWGAIDDIVNDDAGSSDGPGITVSPTSPLPMALAVCQYSCQSPPNQCFAATGFGNGAGGALPIVGSTVFNITSVTSTGAAASMGITGYFVPSVGTAGPRCSSLVE